MSPGWTVVLAVGLVTVGFKAAGPALLGGRELPSRVAGAVEDTGPAVLAALIATQTVTTGSEVVFDARLPGVLCGGLLLARGAPTWIALAAAALVTAAVRLLA